MLKEKLKKEKEGVYILPKSGKRRVDLKIFLSEKLKDSLNETAIEQLAEISKLPGIESVYGMSDIHPGYDFPIGGVVAFNLQKGVLFPAGVGYDINCGVRVLRTNIKKKDFLKKRDQILKNLFRDIPSGLGKGSKFQINEKNLNKVLKEGSRILVEMGFGDKEDISHTEELGKIHGADPEDLSKKAKRKGIGQLGTLGAGNHFLEFQFVEKIFNKKAARIFGIKKNQILVMIHTGSRGLGHQVTSDYLEEIKNSTSLGLSKSEEIKKKNKEEGLLFIPLKNKLSKKYFSAMACASNFAFANRQLITSIIRKELIKEFPRKKIFVRLLSSKKTVEVLYDLCHNIARIEKNNGKELLVFRKGATRSLGKGAKELPEDYRNIGQPILLPGSMGTSSYILLGDSTAEKISLGSCPHGSGRLKSRSEMRRNLKGEEVLEELKKKNIRINFTSKDGLVEEASESYKDIEEVVSVVDRLGIGKRVARLKPLGVIKG